ncbi:MAG: monofunctional biosynthetic peptidoglycan transglycosylase [Hyphomonadaceae bacterium]
MSGDEEDRPPPPEEPAPQAPEPPPQARAPEPPPRSYSDEPEPEIPMPRRERQGGFRAREARKNLDHDLGRIKRRKRFGWLITIVSVLFIALVLAPVTWVAVYRFIDPPTITMMQRASQGQTIRHYPVPISRISPHVVRAVIAAEDSRFCSHDGFDFEAIRDAMERNAQGGRVRGASTVSQQTAKNLFLWQGRTWIRKGIEVYFTALIEFMWPKRRIMEAYLNAAEWGDGNFGIEAAARARFGVSAADLTPLQAARLAAVLPNPNEWRADNPGPRTRERAQMLMARARDVRAQGLASCVLLLDQPGA